MTLLTPTSEPQQYERPLERRDAGMEDQTEIILTASRVKALLLSSHQVYMSESNLNHLSQEIAKKTIPLRRLQQPGLVRNTVRELVLISVNWKRQQASPDAIIEKITETIEKPTTVEQVETETESAE